MGIVRTRLGENAQNFKAESGVYFLYSGSEVIYIGESCDIKRRLFEHLGFKSIDTTGKSVDDIIRYGLQNHRTSSIISKNKDSSEFLITTDIGRVVDYVEVIYTQDRKVIEKDFIAKYQPVFNQQHNPNYDSQQEKRNILRATASVIGAEYWEDSELGYYWQVLETIRTLRDFRPPKQTKEVA